MLNKDETPFWLSANQCVLIPLPPTPMDIREVLHLASPASGSKPLDFAEPVAPIYGGWLVIRYGDVASVSEMSRSAERMLNIAEVVYGVTLYHKLRGVNLLEASYALTATRLGDGKWAHVAYPGAEHFVVKGIWANDRWEYISGLTL
ncbi:hypothetical protein K2P47_02950 [Patescibacteria group bacterium]|nr:hypothetical protein [Patescibacteria group bacterium]